MTEEEIKTLERKATGKKNKAAGEIFEEILSRSLEWYANKGLMNVKKTPEPMKPLKPCGKGKFIACFTKPAQVDFSGTIMGGRAIRFEAKHTDTGKFTRDRLTSEQMEDLREHESLGAYCCVMVSFGFDKYYRIPWLIWKNMKTVFGRQYFTEEEVQGFRLKTMAGGLIELLGDTTEEKIIERWLE